jgi:hypothetical protein
MQHQGVHYDTGTVFRGPGYVISTRRTALDMSVVRRELEIVPGRPARQRRADRGQ